MRNVNRIDRGAGKGKRRSPFWLADTTRPLLFAHEEKVMAIFQPDVLILEEFMVRRRKPLSPEPEKSLMLAVLQDAVMCFQDNLFTSRTRNRMLHRDAERWFLDRNSRDLFCFENVCDWLGLNADYLRSGLMQWKAAALAARKPSRAAG